ncbi:DUF5681 domain-containing protein [Acidisoma sp. S159]|uniref:DUF5681 domain-containing protein n=1 Tax=Acidisoma sp. S159 TaxID=1747225 RepID=UPI00131B78A0|nr:DUF5681 domain-containing protein [Acidisoma sp. S159]
MATDDLPRQRKPKPRGPGKRFQPGKSGNPAGPKPGTRHAALAALDVIGQDGAEAVLKAVVAQALEGDTRAADILLRRVWPERKGRPVTFNLPIMKTPADLTDAMSAVSVAMAAGELSPEEAASAASVIEVHRRALDTHDLAARIAALEAGNAQRA